MITFRQFLRMHRDDDTPIGDPARDLRDDACGRHLRGVRQIRQHMVDGSIPLHPGPPDQAALDTFDKAVRMWKAARALETR
jgi:hypothetical protein